jgi:acetoin:2,6-dichlorophenolindophenol oxidoreductase subunit alpha
MNRLLKMYETMVLSRKFDDLLIDLFHKGQIPGFIHSGNGQEAIGVGSCFDLNEDDYIYITHRGFAHSITKGMAIEKIAAEMCGKATGYSKGKGGFHMGDLSLGVLGISGSLGACFPMSVGTGLTAQIKGKQQVVLCFFGDGSSNREVFHSSLNMAALWKLPIVFICENNRWGITNHISKSVATETIAIRATAYGMPGETIDGNDVQLVNETINKAIALAREGCGPSLIECLTYRWQPHAEGYPYFGAENDAEVGKNYCPINKLAEKLIASGVEKSELDAISAAIDVRIELAREFAVNSPFPEISTAWDDFYIGGEN